MSKYSYGIACTRFNKSINKYEILLVEKRCTYAFYLFTFGLYNYNNLHQLLNNMTREEKKCILSGNYSLLYFRATLKQYENITRIADIMNYKKAQNIYEKLSINELSKMMINTTCISCIWEFPKGRKNMNEICDDENSDKVCAIREFEEETGIKNNQYTIINDKPVKVEFTDCGMTYIYYLYVGFCDNNTLDFSFKNHDINNYEISDIKWVNSADSRKYLSGKLNLAFKNIVKIVKNNKKLSNDISKRKITEDNREIAVETRI